MKRIALISFLLASLPLFVSAQSLEEARKLTENEQYEAAGEVYKQLISREPANGNYYYYYGKNFLLGENTDSAKTTFKKGQEADPSNLLLKMGDARIMLDYINVLEAKNASEKEPGDAALKNRYEESKTSVATATGIIESAVAGAPQKSATVYVEAAEAFIQYSNKNLERAKQLLDKALSIEPKNIDATLLYGDIYAELNNGSLAAEYYNKALDMNRNSARAIVSKGRLYKRSTNFEGAATEFSNAITIDPNYAPAYRELGESEFRLGKLAKAKENYKKYLELSKNNCSARIRYSAFLYLSKDYDEALNELSQVQKKCDATNITVQRILAYCYYETKDYTKGLETMEKIFNQLPENKRAPFDYEYYGKLLVANNQDSLGVINLRKAYNLNPNRTDLLSDIANAHYKGKNYSEVTNSMNEKIATGKDPKPMDYYLLGRAYYFKGQFLEADTAFSKLNDISPTYASGWLWRAKANTHIDSTSENGLAKPFYEKYIEIATADSANSTKYQSGLIEAYGYLAYYYILKKDNDNACIYLQKKVLFPLEPEDKKNVQTAIDQLQCKK